MQHKYMSSAVNVLAHILKIKGQNKSDFFQLNLPGIHGKKDNSGALLLSAVVGTR